MAEETSQPQEQSLVPVVQQEIKTIVELADKYLPAMESGSKKAVAAMKEWLESGIEDDEDREAVNNLCVRVRDAHTKISDKRKEVTTPIDRLKKRFMEYERPLSDDKDSDYTKCRGMIAAFDQKKIDDKKRIEQEAAARKQKENHLVDLKTLVLNRLNAMVVAKTKKSEEGSAGYFAACTFADFDARAENYKKMKPKLPPEDWKACFDVVFETNNTLINATEYDEFITKLMAEETHEKWNEEVIQVATPIINAWRAKIPELKENLIKLKNAADENERQRIADQQATKAQEEADRRSRELEQQSLEKSRNLQSQADLEKLSNSFVEQATLQSSEPVGPVKYSLKFTDRKGILKAFTIIVAQVMASPKFEGIEKKKDGKVILDPLGNPVYIDQVQKWIDFFMSNCDAEVPGTEVFEQSKVIIRK